MRCGPLVDLELMGAQIRAERFHRYRLQVDPAYRAADEQRQMLERDRLERISARTAADRELGFQPGDQVVIGQHFITTAAGVRLNLEGTPATLLSLEEMPCGGLLATVEVVQETAALKPVITLQRLAQARLRGELLGRIRRSQPRTRYQLPLAKLSHCRGGLALPESLPESPGGAVVLPALTDLEPAEI
jgi:hypothetical protein